MAKTEAYIVNEAGQRHGYSPDERYSPQGLLGLPIEEAGRGVLEGANGFATVGASTTVEVREGLFLFSRRVRFHRYERGSDGVARVAAEADAVQIIFTDYNTEEG